MTIKKRQKNTPENRAEMARHGAPPDFGYLTPLQNDLNVPRGCDFEKNAQDEVLSGIFRVFHKKVLKYAKSMFKAPLKGCLKLFSKNGKSHGLFFPIFPKRRILPCLNGSKS